MKVLICVIVLMSCALVNSLNIVTNRYENFPNKCSADVNMEPYIRIGEKYYFIETTKKLNWFGAAHFCRNMNAYLATIESAEEMESISQHFVKLDYKSLGEFWISGNDLQTEGNFECLSTGKPMVYTKWLSEQPDNKEGKENCVHLSHHEAEYFMNDFSCSNKSFFICERNTPKTISLTIW